MVLVHVVVIHGALWTLLYSQPSEMELGHSGTCCRGTRPITGCSRSRSVHKVVLVDLCELFCTRSSIRVVLPVGYLALAVQLRGHSHVVKLDENRSRWGLGASIRNLVVVSSGQQ